MMQEGCATANGVKLRNPCGTNLCYLNTAINCVAMNKKLRSLAFEAEVGQRKLAEEDVLTELKNILRLQDIVGDSSMLRRLLHAKFNRFEEGEQNDAADAFFSILECVSGADNYCRLNIKVNYTCVECGFKKSKIDDTQLSLMLFDASNINITLQDAVDQWVSRISMVEFSCECKEQLLLGSGFKPEMFYTKHKEEYEMLDTPDILHIKVKDREIRDNSIEIKEILYLNGTR